MSEFSSVLQVEEAARGVRGGIMKRETTWHLGRVIKYLGIAEGVGECARDRFGPWHSYIDLRESVHTLDITTRKCELVCMGECAIF